MTTILAQQLKKLEVPQTVQLARDKQRVSFLFDPKEAANLDGDTVYCLGVNGLEELILIEDEFKQFERNLFDVGSKTFVRSMQTQEVNDNLNVSINTFLLLVSPYALLRPAHKALEWLIFRFQIHLYNSDALIACFIPYHGTNVFVRAVQLLDLRNSQWDWLLNVQKSGMPLAKSAIINYAMRNMNFLSFICRIVDPLMKERDEKRGKRFEVTFSFYSSSLVGVIRQMKKNNTQIVICILPYIINGLKSPLADLKCSSLMMISQLASKSRLTSEFCSSFVTNIVGRTLDQLPNESMMCLLVIFQTQNYKKFERKILRQILRTRSLMDFLCEMEERFDVISFVRPVLLKSLRLAVKFSVNKKKKRKIGCNSAYLTFCKKLLSSMKLEGDLVRDAIRKIVQLYKKHLKLEHCENTELKTITGTLLSIFEMRYPDIFDEIMNETMRLAKYKKSIHSLLKSLNKQNKVKLGAKTVGTSLYLNLNDASAAKRRAAVQRLIQRIKEEKESDEKFIEQALVTRLLDDDYHIPILILSEIKIVNNFIPSQILLDTIKLLFEKKWFKKGKNISIEIAKRGLTVICSNPIFFNNDDMVLFFIFPYIFPTNEPGVELAKHLCSLPMFNTHPLLLKLDSCFANSEDINNCFGEVTKTICTRLQVHPDFSKIMQNLINKSAEVSGCRGIHSQSVECSGVAGCRSVHFQFFTMNVLRCLLSAHESVDVVYLGRLLVALCSSGLKYKLDSRATNSSDYFKKVNSNRFPVQFISDTLSLLIKSIKIPSDLIESNWWSSPSVEHQPISFLLFDLFNLILYNVHVEKKSFFRDLLQLFISHHFSEPSTLLHFLGHFWTNNNNDDDNSESIPNVALVTRSSALLITEVFFRSTKSDLRFLNNSNNSVIPLLLVSLDTSLKNIRVLVLNCFQEIYNREISNFVYKPLVKKLVKQRQEIEVDENHLSTVLSSTLRSEKNKTILDLLVRCIISPTTPNFVSARLLHNFQYIESRKILISTHEMLKRILQLTSVSHSDGIIVDCILRRYTAESMSEISPQDSVVESLITALQSLLLISHKEMTCQQVALKLLRKNLFEALEEPIQQRLFSLIVDLQVKNQDPTITSTLSRTLKKIFVDSNLVITEFRRMLTSLKKGIRPIKKPRLSINQENKNTKEEIAMISWEHVDFILEMINKKKNIDNVHKLIPIFFDLLKACLDSESAEFRKQMILQCIHHCCTKIIPEQQKLMNEKDVNVDLIVQCLRVSKDNQTHNHALILLGLMANLFPETVLHNVMAIFTFMGTNMLRQDDLYSFQIMERTTNAVVPAILSVRHRAMKDKEPVSMILRIFVDAFPDVPLHRRIPVFTKLLDSLDAKVFLGLALLQLMELHVTKRGVVKNVTGTAFNVHKELNSEFGSAVKFALDLSAHYSPLIQLHACFKIIQYLSLIPNEKSKSGAEIKKLKYDRVGEVVVFDVEKRSPKELRHFQFVCVTFVASVLSNKLFVEKVSEVRYSQPEEFENSCKVLLEIILQFSNRVASCIELNSENINLKFWKTLLHRTYEVLDKVNALLPGSTFVAVVRSLMSSEFPLVRRKAVELLNSRLQFHPDVCRESEISALCVLLDPLINVIETDCKDNANSNDDSFIISQVALLSLKLLCRLLGHRQVQKLKKVLDVVINVFVDNVSRVVLCGSAILCLVEVCSCLRAHSISSLHKFMPIVLNILSDHSLLFKNELLLQSMVTSVYRLVEVLPHFLSPYLPTLIEQICLISSNPSIVHKGSLSSRLETLRHKFSSLIPARVLLPSLKSCFDKLLDGVTFDAIPILMELLKESISVMDNDERSNHFASLQSFFLVALDFRSTHPDESLEFNTRIESSIIEPILTLVMKLSETSFRPMFFKIFSWATQGDVSKDRSITLYHLVVKLTEKLKSLFLLFAGQVIQHAATLLDANNMSKNDILYFKNDDEKTTQFLSFLLAALQKLFLYDREGFVSRERFELLLSPLIDQIENQLGTEDEFQNRILTLIAPCIAQFAEAAADDACWKQLNHQVLLKTRHASAQIRIAALHCIEQLNSHLEKDYLPLLPETIPFLAELMEDESTEVEEKCHKVVAAIETILGEPLNKYF